MRCAVLLQATLCLCNIASHGDECCRELYKHNVLVNMIPVLQLSDAEIVHMALCLVEMILQTCPEARLFSLLLFNFIVDTSFIYLRQDDSPR